MTLTEGRAKLVERDRRTRRRFCCYMKRVGLPACQAFVFSRWTDQALPSQLALFRPFLLYILLVPRKSLTSLWRNKERGKDTVTVGARSVADFTPYTQSQFCVRYARLHGSQGTIMDVTPCGLFECNRYFGGISWIYLQGREIRRMLPRITLSLWINLLITH
jgi:hypothetical protein